MTNHFPADIKSARIPSRPDAYPTFVHGFQSSLDPETLYVRFSHGPRADVTYSDIRDRWEAIGENVESRELADWLNEQAKP